MFRLAPFRTQVGEVEESLTGESVVMPIGQLFPKKDRNNMVFGQLTSHGRFVGVRNLEARPPVPLELHELRKTSKSTRKPSTGDLEIVFSIVQEFDIDGQTV
jgi:hypothetical protein